METGQLLVDDARKFGNPARQFAGEVVPGLPEINQSLAQGLSFRRGVRFLGHPAPQCATGSY
jgi:hypothetical protein